MNEILIEQFRRNQIKSNEDKCFNFNDDSVKRSISHRNGLEYFLSVINLGRKPELHDLFNEGKNEFLKKKQGFNCKKFSSVKNRRKDFYDAIQKYNPNQNNLSYEDELYFLKIIYSRLQIGKNTYLNLEECDKERVHEVFIKEYICALKYVSK